MTDYPTISLAKCEYDKEHKVLKLASKHIGMPLTFFVRSHITGKEIRFTTVLPCDKLYDPDQWDGEQQLYRPTTEISSIDHMVIYNQL